MLVNRSTRRSAVRFRTLRATFGHHPETYSLKYKELPLDRGVQTLPAMHTLTHDIRYALRMIQRNPGVTAIAVLALGLGIGANSAVFAVLNGVLFRSLPFPESDRLLLLSYAPKSGFFATLFGAVEGDFLEFRDRNQAFESVTTFNNTQVSLTGVGEPVRLPSANVTANFFDVLRVKPAIGSGFQPGVPNQVGLGEAIWRTRFHADQGIVGKKIQLDGTPYTVAGVMPAEVHFPGGAELWTLFEVRINPHNALFRPIVGRLKPGWTSQQAYGEFSSILGALHPPGKNSERDAPAAKILPLKELLVGDVRGSLRVFAGAVAFVLLIACANVANLLLMRAEGRRQEIAVRIALGAGNSRLVRQVLTESMVLAVIGGGAGILLALWGVPALLALAPEGSIPRLTEIHVDSSVLAFTFGASILTGLLFGAAPALQTARRSIRDSLTRGSVPVSAGGSGVRGALVIAEVAMAVVLLSGAGLMMKALWRLHAVNPGYRTDNVLTMTVDIPTAVYHETADIQSFHGRVLEKLRGVPGVSAAAAVSSVPLTHYLWRGDIKLEGGRFPAHYALDKLVISGDYFRTMGISLMQGTDFSERDNPVAPKVVILSRSAAATLWPGQNAIGRRISEADHPTEKSWYTVVGVVDDVCQERLTAPPDHAIYFPIWQSPISAWLEHMTFVTREASPDLRIAPVLRAAVHSVDANMPITLFSSMQDIVAATGAERTFQTRLLGAFAALALVLSLIGIYGVAAYSVAMRTREIGIRMALGAQAGSVVALVLRRTLALSATGLVIGVGGSLIATRVLEKMLFEVKPNDPATMIVVAVVLATAAILAGWFPARRAARVDPLVALRWD
jgi:predicted permease